MEFFIGLIYALYDEIEFQFWEWRKKRREKRYRQKLGNPEK